MSDTLLLVVIFLMLLVGALEKLFPQKLNMCKILLCIISLILTIISFLTIEHYCKILFFFHNV